MSDGTNTSAVETVSITINNLNDSPPVVTSGQNFSLNENLAAGTSVGTVAATDPDTGSPTLNNWTIASGNTGGAFSINPSTGAISTNGPLDRESTASYSLGIQVSDGINTSSTETVTVSLNDLNDTAPVISAGQTLTVAENASSGTNLASTPITVSDADVTTTYSGWSIVSGNTGASFSINASTGVISTSATLDFETLASYTLGIQVTDGTNTSATETVTINLTNANDIPPVITSGQTFTIAENVSSGTTVTGTPAAVTDGDGTTTYSGWNIVSGNTGTAFTINASTGVISTNASLDRETTASYTLGLTVSDGVNTSATGTITINLSDLNDTAPVVTAGQNFSINEGNLSNVAVGTVSATDADLWRLLFQLDDHLREWKRFLCDQQHNRHPYRHRKYRLRSHDQLHLRHHCQRWNQHLSHWFNNDQYQQSQRQSTLSNCYHLFHRGKCHRRKCRRYRCGNRPRHRLSNTEQLDHCFGKYGRGIQHQSKYGCPYHQYRLGRGDDQLLLAGYYGE